MLGVVKLNSLSKLGRTVFRASSKFSLVSVGGDVFGISKTEVMPPKTADLLPLSKVSFSGLPGSLKCTWVSINPGNIVNPVQSYVFSVLILMLVSILA